MAREGKKEQKRIRQKRKERGKKIFLSMCLDIRKTEKKEMLEFHISFVWYAKGRENKIYYFYLCALIIEKFIRTFVIS